MSDTCYHRTLPTQTSGFTLMELMIAVVVVAVLSAIVVPAYTSQIRKSRRTEAKSAILDLAGREERLFSTTNTYGNAPANLGYAGAAFPLTIGSGYYSVRVLVTAAAPPNPATFSIVATAIGSQSKDSQCATFSVDQAGRQNATDASGSDTSSVCW